MDSRLTYQEFKDALATVDLSRHPYRIELTCRPFDRDSCTLESLIEVPDRDEPHIRVRVRMSLTMHLPTAGEFPHIIRRMVREIVMHEADEALLINGERVFDPHWEERRRQKTPRPETNQAAV